VSLSPRAIATLGVGFGAVSVAYLGLWPVSTSVEPTPEPSYRPRGAAPFVLDYTPELRDILVRLAAVESPDRARVTFSVSDDRRQITITVRERPDAAAMLAATDAQGRLLAMEPSDVLLASAVTDWSDDDRDFEEIMAALLS
jgi:hypothetical protein